MRSKDFENAVPLGQPMAPRRILQIALVIPAFLLFSISWRETAGLAVFILLFELYALPALSSDFSKDAGALPSRSGQLLFPIALIILALVFRHYLAVVAGAWALATVGDGLAGACGEAWGYHALPFNGEKTWEGFAAFVVAGGAAAFLLFLWVSNAEPGLKPLLICLGAAVVGAFVESLPIRLDDNITVPLIAGGFLFCAAFIERASVTSNLPYLGIRIILAVVISLGFALLAWSIGQITPSGAAAGFLLSMAVYMGFGYKSFLILLCFFVLGTAATRMGYEYKRARGIAERRRGARGWREAAANLLVPAYFSILVISTPHQWAFLAAMVAALAEAAGDTVSSEAGKWLSPRAWLITSLRPVEAGADGGVSLAGAVAGFGASAIVVLLSYGLGLCTGWNAVAAFAAAVLGNLTDSVLGAELERRGLVTNGIVNFMGTSLAGALALAFALR